MNVTEKTIRDASKDELAVLLIEAVSLIAVLTYILEHQEKQNDARQVH